MHNDSLTTVESMKYQVHFEGKIKLGFRHRVQQVMELLGFEAQRRGALRLALRAVVALPLRERKARRGVEPLQAPRCHQQDAHPAAATSPRS